MTKAFGKDNIKYDATGRMVRVSDNNSRPKYLWNTPNPFACSECLARDGKVYDYEPQRPHYGCKCEITEFYGELPEENNELRNTIHYYTDPDPVEILFDDKDEKSKEGSDSGNNPTAPKPGKKPQREDVDGKSDEQKGEDDELIDGTYKKVEEFEDNKEHPYLDTKGNVTTGVGNNIDGASDPKGEFMKIPWQKDGRPATQEEKEVEWARLQEMKENMPRDENGNINTQADSYKERTELRLPKGYAEEKAKEYLEEELERLREEYITFDNAPNEIQRVLLDIGFNLGEDRFNRYKWSGLAEGMDNQDWDKVAGEVSRKTKHKDRNDWAIREARKGAERMRKQGR